MNGGTGVDPPTAAYRVHAHAFNTLTQMLAADDRFVPLPVREAIAGAIVEAVVPLIRADERAQVQPAPPSASQVRRYEAQAAPDLELAGIIADRNQFRIALERIAGMAAGTATKRQIGDTARRALEST